MTEFVLASDYRSALSHFAGYGLAAILEDSGVRGLRMFWSDGDVPRLVLTGAGDPLDVASAVRDHASAHSVPSSWVQRIFQVQGENKQSEVGLFSPRIASPANAVAWNALYDKRHDSQDLPENSGWLDSLMLQALGEPAHWLVGTDLNEPDRGASRWEMKTRNRGEDFTRNRLAKLAATVSARTAGTVLAGLTGESVVDEAGKNSDSSRSATGLARPGIVDNAIAWCALWGISWFRLTPRVKMQAFTPGAVPQNRVHPHKMALPLVTQATSPARLRRVLRSAAFDTYAFSDDGSTARAAAAEELRRSGVNGYVVFPIEVAGSSSAPERIVLSGMYNPI